MYLSLASGSRFAAVYRTGSRSRRGGVTVIQALGDKPTPEVGFVAGKKVGNAVLRNRAKRRLREATRGISLVPGTSYVIIASPQVLDAPFPVIVGWLEDAVRSGAMRNAHD